MAARATDKASAGVDPAHGLTKAEDARFPLTQSQTAMLYESSLSGRPGANLRQVVLRFTRETVHEDALHSAWQAATDRHAMLRICTDWSDAGDAARHPDQAAHRGPTHMPAAPAHIGLKVLDWSAHPDAEARLESWLPADRARGADPAIWPNWRLQLIRLPRGHSALVWTFPRILLDDESLWLVLAEVFADYDAAVAGDARPLRPAPADFALYCRVTEAPADPAMLDRLARMLDGFDAANEICAAHPFGEGRPGQGSAATLAALGQDDRTDAFQSGASGYEIGLPADLTTALARRAEQAGATLETALNAAWGLVLARSSGKDMAVFGLEQTGRQLLGQSPTMIGCLTDTQPLALHLLPGQTLDGLLQQMRDALTGMTPLGHGALTQIRARLGLAHGQPLFETSVVHQPLTVAERLAGLGAAWAGRRVEVLGESALPLTLTIIGTDAPRLRLDHDPARVDTAAARRYLDWYVGLLRAMAWADSEAPVASLSMLSAAETTLLLENAAGPAPRSAPVASLSAGIAERAALHPDSPAVIQADGSVLTFAELDRQADRLAARLAGLGAGPGRIVALCLPRSSRHVVAMLAIRRTGAAFLPMDPAYPPETLGYMLRDSQAMLVLVGRTAPWMAEYDVLALTDEMFASPETGDLSSLRPETPIPPEQTAYLIYTSGTTGRPKGVRIPSQALTRHAAAATDWLGLTERDRVLQFTSLSFDVSIEEIVPTLLAGATLCLRPDSASTDPRLLLDHVARHAITVLNLPTGFWQALLDDMEMSGRRLPASVRLVVAGGERVPPAALRRWRAIQPDTDWSNGYGPTEATITSAAFVLPAGQPVPEGEVPVGRPLAHARMYVLAADGSLAPPCCPGHLWIGGPCVATGYLDRPDLNAEKFRPDPFARGGRIYSSGDLARWRADGQLDLGGRADRQVKLRGFRIEPAEVERVIEGLDTVGQAVVRVLDAGSASARLVAWVRPANPGEVLEVAELEQAAAALLAPQMRPAIVPVTDWPMRPGGKIDIDRLPRPGPRMVAAAPAHDPTIQTVSAQFATMLGLPQATADTNFFDAGGHSLLLIRLIGWIESRFGLRLSVADLHADPTPRGIAGLLASGRTGKRSLEDCIVAIQPQGSLPPIYGVHVLGANGSFYRPLAEEMGKDQPILGLTVGVLDAHAPTGVEETAELYHRVIDRHYPKGPLSLAAVSLGAYVAVELAQRLLEAGRDVTMLILLDADGPGGRPRIGTAGRIWLHLRRLGNEGPRYGLRLLNNRLGDLAYRVERLKLMLSGLRGGARGSATTMAGFVAANIMAVESYSPRPYPGRLTIIRATRDNFDSPLALETGLGWAPVATGGFDLYQIGGDHLSILEQPGVVDLAQVIRMTLARR